MKYIALLVTIILLLNYRVSGQSPEVKHLIDTTIQLLKRHSVNTDSVKWDSIKKTVFLKADKIDDPYKLGPAIRYLFQAVNDFHGAFYYKDSIFRWQHDAAPNITDSIMNEWNKGVSIRTSILSNEIGYLRIPAMPFHGKADADQKASSLNDSLCSLLQKKSQGIILDLRLNGGGAMYPMILGLKQLLDTGYLGLFSANNEKWYIRNNNFLLDTTVVTSVIPACNIDAKELPIVALIGPGTQSSGEFLLIALKSRRNVILLGSATGGYVSSNAGFPINKDAYILIATGYGVDKNGQVYKEALEPDILVKGADSFNDIENDIKVKAALKCFSKEFR
jgi:carboxyl-terminal processing protease